MTMRQKGHLDDLSLAIKASLTNGDRLVEDAQQMLDMARYPTAYALSILAQEQYAKAFLLHLIQTQSIPWNPDVRRTLKDHTCKQLLASIMDFLEPDLDEFLARLEKRKDRRRFPSHITDALKSSDMKKCPEKDNGHGSGKMTPLVIPVHERLPMGS